MQAGALIRVKAPRQMGKTSLLSRILHYAVGQGQQTAELSFQLADAKCLKDLDLCLKWFCSKVTHELNLANRVQDYWQDDFLGAKDKCSTYFQPGAVIEPLNPLDAIASTQLPGDFHKDPADRILIAIARRYSIPLITCDQKILSYPHVETVW